MDKFWQWVEKKGYGRIINKNKILYNGNGEYLQLNEFPKQMLIGYMIEYIHLNGYMYYVLNDNETINDYYEILKTQIEHEIEVKL